MNKIAVFHFRVFKVICNLFATILLIFTINYSAIGQAGVDTLPGANGLGISPIFLANKTDIRTLPGGEIWVGLRSAGLLYYNGATWSAINSTNTAGQLPSDSITQIFANGGADIWIGTAAGLTRKTGSVYTNIPFNSSPSFPQSRINALLVAGQEVFAGTNHGLSVYNLNTQTWTRYFTGNTSLLNDTILSLFYTPGGQIWMGTKEGYAIYVSGAISVFNYQNSGIPSTGIKDIAITPFDTLLLSEKYGVIRRDSGTYRNLDSMYFGYFTTNFCDSLSQYSLQWNGFPSFYYTRFAISSSQEIYSVKQTFSNVSTSAIICFHANRTISTAEAPIFLFGLNAPIKPVLCIYQSDSLIWNKGYPGSSDMLFKAKQWNTVTYQPEDMPIQSTVNPATFPANIPPSYVGGPRENLTGNMIRAGILNRGDLHWDPVGQVPYYEAPIGSGKTAVYCSSVWLGGYDSNDSLYVAAQTYRQGGANDFWPGPLDTLGHSDSTTRSVFDHIWMARRSDIDEFRYQFSIGNVQNGNYPIAPFILNWPAHYNVSVYPQKLAPYIDYNGDNLYNPLDGDYPDVKGDQMAWWIFNDDGMKTETNSLPMELEIQAYAYSFNCADSGVNNIALSYTTFYHYDVFNRKGTDYDSCYFGMWSDMDLGNASDDFVGCDVVNNSFFTYNGDADDEGGGGFGLCPPIQNVSLLKGPPAPPGDGKDNNHNGVTDENGEDIGLSVFTYYTSANNLPNGNPVFADDYYQYLSGSFLNGQHFTYGGDAMGGGTGSTSTPTNFMYPGSSDPAFSTPWTMTTAGMFPTDMRGLGSYGPFNLPAGGSASFDLAFITGPHDTLSNQAVLSGIRNLFRNGNLNVYSGNIPAIQGPASVSGAGAGGTYTVSLPNTSGYNFLWTVQNGVILNGQGTNTISVIWGTNGIGQVKLEVLQTGIACKSEKTLTVQIGSQVGISESNSETVVKIYPNPVHSILNIETNDSRISKYRIFNLQGILLYVQPFAGTLNTLSLTTGVYILEILDAKNKVMLRKMFIKE